MADHSAPFPLRVAAVLPYVLPVLFGAVAMFLADEFGDANPVFAIVIAVILGRIVAWPLVRILEAMADRQDRV